jgi:hypothetical protein
MCWNYGLFTQQGKNRAFGNELHSLHESPTGVQSMGVGFGTNTAILLLIIQCFMSPQFQIDVFNHHSGSLEELFF